MNDRPTHTPGALFDELVIDSFAGGGAGGRPAGAAHALGVTTTYLSHTHQGDSTREGATGTEKRRFAAAVAKPTTNIPDGQRLRDRRSFPCAIAAHLTELRGTSKDGQPVDRPAATFTANGNHAGLVAAFLQSYYGNSDDGSNVAAPLPTVTTRDRAGLVTVNIEGQPTVPHIITDIGMRMLTPRELFRCQGFPDSYVIDPIVDGKPLTKSAQVRMVGNSVCPQVAAALVRANLVASALPVEAA